MEPRGDMTIVAKTMPFCFLLLCLVGCAGDRIPVSSAPGRNSSPICPEDFGAKGDGQTDDTAALRAMAEAVNRQGGNATIVFSTGKTYLIGHETTKRGQETILF